jgi:hypothetical protein
VARAFRSASVDDVSFRSNLLGMIADLLLSLRNQKRM